MARHPYVVPAEHRDRDEQYRRVHQLLADAGGSSGDLGGEEGHQGGAYGACRQAAAHPKAAPRRAGAGRQNDADDQRRLEHLAKDNNGRAEHCDIPRYLTTIWPRAVVGLKSPKNSYRPGLSGPM